MTRLFDSNFLQSTVELTSDANPTRQQLVRKNASLRAAPQSSEPRLPSPRPSGLAQLAERSALQAAFAAHAAAPSTDSKLEPAADSSARRLRVGDLVERNVSGLWFAALVEAVNQGDPTALTYDLVYRDADRSVKDCYKDTNREYAVPRAALRLKGLVADEAEADAREGEAAVIWAASRYDEALRPLRELDERTSDFRASLPGAVSEVFGKPGQRHTTHSDSMNRSHEPTTSRNEDGSPRWSSARSPRGARFASDGLRAVAG